MAPTRCDSLHGTLHQTHWETCIHWAACELFCCTLADLPTPVTHRHQGTSCKYENTHRLCLLYRFTIHVQLACLTNILGRDTFWKWPISQLTRNIMWLWSQTGLKFWHNVQLSFTKTQLKMWMDRHVWKDNWTSFIMSALHYESDNGKSEHRFLDDLVCWPTTVNSQQHLWLLETAAYSIRQQLQTHDNASDVAAFKATDGNVKWPLQRCVDSLRYQTVQVNGPTQQLKNITHTTVYQPWELLTHHQAARHHTPMHSDQTICRHILSPYYVTTSLMTPFPISRPLWIT